MQCTSTGSEPFSVLICLDATKFVLPSVFTLNEAIYPNICFKTRFKRAKISLPVDVRAQNVAAFLKDTLFSLSRRHSQEFVTRSFPTKRKWLPFRGEETRDEAVKTSAWEARKQGFSQKFSATPKQKACLQVAIDSDV